jgi:hypothetical protein
MTQWVDQIKEGLPDYAKDTRLNIDAVISSRFEPAAFFSIKTLNRF